MKNDINISILIATKRPYELFAKKVVDSLYTQDMSKNEIIICSTSEIFDNRITYINDIYALNGAVGFNQAASVSSGKFLAILTDDHYPPNNMNDIPKLFDTEYFKNKDFKVATMKSGGDCYINYNGKRILMCRFPILTRDTYEKLNYCIFPIQFTLTNSDYCDHYLNIFLNKMGCDCIDFPMRLVTFADDNPEYQPARNPDINGYQILQNLISNYGENDVYFNRKYTVDDLINFETDIADIYNSGKIKAPVHLYYGNELKMIEIFNNIKDDDWVFCTWRSHYQCLLKGVNPLKLKYDILYGKSISLCYPSHNIYSSAIVTGNIPIATGVAMDIKRKSKKNHVWCFIGDMTSETGTFFENWKYSVNYDLPITYIIENNRKSVCTDTYSVWNTSSLFFEREQRKIIYYEYSNKYPHAGAGKRIQF